MAFNFANENAFIEGELLADVLGVSKATLEKWQKTGKIKSSVSGLYQIKDLMRFQQIQIFIKSQWQNDLKIQPLRPFRAIECFAGAGGLALGLEKAGFQKVLVNEIDAAACLTLQSNRPQWPVLEKDIKQVDFSDYKDIDLLSGGFPCQAFSYAGKQLGFADTRGTLFFEFAKAIQTLQPKVFLAENVRGLLEHDQGRTLATMQSVMKELGYVLMEPKILKALFYQVPQKRERLFLVGIRADLWNYADFHWPAPCSTIYVLRDALKKGDLYADDCPLSPGQKYPAHKAKILSLIPPGGYWRDLPDDLQREYLQGSYFLGGGKTGMARRLHWDVPSLTLTCAPAQKQTERCHPEESRPLTVREYARIQTFPDDWQFCGSITQQYKQIGNAVPVNLAWAVARQLVALLNSLELAETKIKTAPSQQKLQQLSLFD